jgi:hypothetical protein
MRLLKLTRVELKLGSDAAAWVREGFSQELDLESSRIRIRLGAAESPRFILDLWVDAHRPILWIETDAEEPVSAQAKLCCWRTRKRELSRPEAEASTRQDGTRQKAFEYPDETLEPPYVQAGQLGLVHANRYSMLPELLEHQALGELNGQIDDPIVNRTFGCVLFAHSSTREEGEQLAISGDLAEQVLGLPPSQKRRLCIVAHTAHVPSVGEWADEVHEMIGEAERLQPATAREDHARWWREFWDRSYIDIWGDEGGEAVARAYALQRFVTACAGRGEFPIKFNGSIFTVDGPEMMVPRRNDQGEVVSHEPEVFNADMRRWGGGYWFQNTRLIYWPLLASGDHEMLKPWFAFFERIAGLAEARYKRVSDQEGLFFPETLTIWGTYRNDNYGYDRPENLETFLPQNRYIRWYFTGNLELCAILLEYLAYTNDALWWRRRAFPLVSKILGFYYSYFSTRDEAGNVRIDPAQSLETWQRAVNPTPDVAGLRHVLEQLVGLDERLVPPVDREFMERFLEELPEIPLGPTESGASAAATDSDELKILPAQSYTEHHNMENPELYAVFPFPLGAMGSRFHAEAERAYEERRFRNVGGWFQDAVQAAMLGRGEEAADMLVAALAPQCATEEQARWLKWPQHADIRFPGFFGPNVDWFPDQDHGCVSMLALQRMLLHTHGDRMRVLPAWPRAWNVRFKLHAPNGSVVEAAYEDGRLTTLTTSPLSLRSQLDTPEGA